MQDTSPNDWLDPDLEVEIPAPREGMKLFSGASESWEYSASLRTTGLDPWDSYALGFKQLADVGVEAVGDPARNVTMVFPDAIVYSIVFNYRHYLEVRMKSLILKAERLLDRTGGPLPSGRKGHDLVYLWDRLRPLIEALWPESVTQDETISAQIAEFAAVDSGSFAFRYPVSLAGDPSLPTLSGINVLRVKSVIDGIASVFEGSDTGIHEMLQTKWDMMADARADAAAYADIGGFSD